jgi:hypothetical protein
MTADREPAPTLDEVRERLRAQGYLDAGIERAIFTAPRASGAVMPSVLAGAVALAMASAAAVFSRGGATPAAGVLLVFLVLFVLELPLALAAGGALYALSRSLRVPQNPRRSAVVAASAAAVLVFLFFSVGARRLPSDGGRRRDLLLALVPVCIAAFYFARAVRATTLSLWLRRHVSLPDRPGFRRGSAAALILVLAAASLSVGRGPRASSFPDLAVTPREKPLLIIGLDGLAPQSLALLAPDVPSVSWRRAAGPPPEAWTTLATGVSPQRHGVAAFERASLFSVVALRPPFFTAWAFRGPLRWVGASGRLPVSGAERRAYTFWEVAARSGIAVAAVNWWASEPVPGAQIVDNAEVAARAGSGSEDDAIAIARLREVRDRAHPRLSTIYLPGADIDRGDISAAARRFLSEEIARARSGEQNVWLVSDSGRSGQSGAAAFFDDAALGAVHAGARPEDLAPTALARLGVPAASDLEGAPLFALFRGDALERRRAATYGARTSREPVAGESATGREYLQKLKSLGYLQ